MAIANESNFQSDITNLLAFFHEHLGINNFSNEVQHPIAREVIACIEDTSHGNLTQADARYRQLLGLADNLSTIKLHSNQANFRRFCKKISDAENYIGARFEALVCSALVKGGLKIGSEFLPQDRPDFKIKGASDLFIECTSVSFHPDKKDINKNAISKKICDAVEEKSKKSYATKRCALFIDWTYLFQIIMDLRDPEMQKCIDNLMSCITQKTNYGTVVLFSYAYEKDKKKFQVLPGRYDTADIDSGLEKLLDKYVPRGRFKTSASNMAFPQQG
jgi:hypothetical protein